MTDLALDVVPVSSHITTDTAACPRKPCGPVVRFMVQNLQK